MGFLRTLACVIVIAAVALGDNLGSRHEVDLEKVRRIDEKKKLINFEQLIGGLIVP